MQKRGEKFNLPSDIGLGIKRVEIPREKIVGFDIEREDIINYNDSLLEVDENGEIVFDEMYTNLTFSPDKVLVRLFLQEPTITKAGLLTYPNTPYETVTINTQGASGRSFEHELVKNPFKFMTMGVVVVGNDFFESGDIIQIPPVTPKASKLRSKNWIEYDYQFVHPLSNLITPSQNPSERWFGYALIGQFSVICKLDIEDVLKFFYRDEK